MMEEKDYLYKEFVFARKFNVIKQIPDYIISNLSVELREYQKEAFENTITYFEDKNYSKNKKKHLLYHMATGSGKTLIMAGMMLYLYKQGYRNFVFFVNAKNIVSKTIDNFLLKDLSKYLFAQNIVIDGKNIDIKQVNNFQHVDKEAINICCTTIQGLHSSLWKPKENSLTIADFEDEKVVLISDEAHHINADTASGKLSKEQKEDLEDNKSWEYSVARVFDANINSVMLEFTATCDLRNPYIIEKYMDKIIYDYPLAKFRESGYTKDFLNFQSNTDLWTRSLQALLISQYRLKIFQFNKINIKPIILLKSKTIDESKAFYNEFFERLKNISTDEIEKIKVINSDNFIFNNMFDYYDKNHIGEKVLIEELKLDFSKEHAVLMNDKEILSAEMQKSINSLEDINNPYRILFTVDMLNEGWDVLNLFDIVRLYDTRQGGHKGKVSNYTIKEAQLIGRGARYCPFAFDVNQVKGKRKYDKDIDNEYRICETMLYHSKQDSEYISELKRALKETGLLPKEEPTEIKLELKESFKRSALYQKGYLFKNDRIIKDKHDAELPEKLRSFGVQYTIVGSHGTNIVSLFTDEKHETDSKEVVSLVKSLKEMPYNIVNAAIRRFEELKFSNLKQKFPKLKTTKEFITSDLFAGNMKVEFKIVKGAALSETDMYEGCLLLMEELSHSIVKIKYVYEGTKNFRGVPIIQAFKPTIRRYIKNDTTDNGGIGVSQNSPYVDEKYRLDLSDKDWYAFNDNYGTTEEKSFVKYLYTIIEKFQSKYQHVYLLRNEEEFKIYSFSDGEPFEPDFVLFLWNEQSSSPLYYQIFIEPKGDFLLEKDKWKETFLKQIHDQGKPMVILSDNNEYCIWGLPFYNENNKMDEFVKSLSEFYM